MCVISVYTVQISVCGVVVCIVTYQCILQIGACSIRMCVCIISVCIVSRRVLCVWCVCVYSINIQISVYFCCTLSDVDIEEEKTCVVCVVSCVRSVCH